MSRALLAAPVWLALVAGCDGEEEEQWRQFNGVDDRLTIEVQPGEPGGEAVIELHSNTGLRVVGTAEVTPATGPVGTDHRIAVVVGEDWAERVTRATVSADSDRGPQSFEMIRDSAVAGVFDLTLTSLGEPDEVRSDVWTISLYEPIDLPAAEAE